VAFWGEEIMESRPFFRWLALVLLVAGVLTAAFGGVGKASDDDIRACVYARYGNISTAVAPPCTRPCGGLPGGFGGTGILVSSTYEVYLCAHGL
jgi:hypothetical protein